ncbi:MAG: monovalent cation/H(+) antiporter subunit G [Bacteroidales bacterium]|nr:monovalent cation/H(+) antiporter subunit G [Bacteroidales bacterium]
MKDILIAITIFAGSLFILIAAIGIIRFNDLYSRMHATTKATSFGLFLLMIGISLSFNQLTIYLKALLIIIFVYLTAPLAAHAIAKSKEHLDEKECK